MILRHVSSTPVSFPTLVSRKFFDDKNLKKKVAKLIIPFVSDSCYSRVRFIISPAGFVFDVLPVTAAVRERPLN